MYKQQSRFFRRLTLFDFTTASGLISPSIPDPDRKIKRKKVKWKRNDKRLDIITKSLNIVRISDNVVKRVKKEI
jgi:hypothetical protein